MSASLIYTSPPPLLLGFLRWALVSCSVWPISFPRKLLNILSIILYAAVKLKFFWIKYIFSVYVFLFYINRITHTKNFASYSFFLLSTILLRSIHAPEWTPNLFLRSDSKCCSVPLLAAFTWDNVTTWILSDLTSRFSPLCSVQCAYVLSHVWFFGTLWIVASRLLGPWDSPDKNTGVHCHFLLLLLQGIFLTQGSNPGSPELQANSLPLSHQGKPPHTCTFL